MPTTPTRLAQMRFGRVRWLRGTWGFLRHLGGRDAFAHRTAILDGSLVVGDIVCFMEAPGHPNTRATHIASLSPHDPLAAVIAELDAQRVKPMRPLDLLTWVQRRAK